MKYLINLTWIHKFILLNKNIYVAGEGEEEGLFSQGVW